MAIRLLKVGSVVSRPILTLENLANRRKRLLSTFIDVHMICILTRLSSLIFFFFRKMRILFVKSVNAFEAEISPVI